MVAMCGLSGAGKTTFAKKYAEENGLRYLCVDEFYRKLNGTELDRSNFFDVWISFFQEIHRCETEDIDILIDTDNLTRGQREQFLEWFPTFEHHLIVIKASEELRRSNNHRRNRNVPEEEMDAMRLRFSEPADETEDKGWLSITRVVNLNNVYQKPERIR